MWREKEGKEKERKGKGKERKRKRKRKRKLKEGERKGIIFYDEYSSRNNSSSLGYPNRVGIMLFVTVVTVTVRAPSTSLMILFPSDVSGHFFITF